MFLPGDGMQAMTAPVRPEIDLGHLPLVEKLRANHPGATMAILDLLRYRRRICEPLDVDTLWCLGALDTLNICGSDLCGLWCGCGQSAERMIQFLKACCDGRCGFGRDAILQVIARSSQELVALQRRQLISVVPGL
jgi:hypothetical protein